MVSIDNSNGSEMVIPNYSFCEQMGEAARTLENQGFTVRDYSIDLYSDIHVRGEDACDVFDDFCDQLQDKGSFKLYLEEPVSDYNRPYFGTEIRYISTGSERYFEVSTDYDGSQVTEAEVDRWVATIERTLIDGDFPVKIGNIHHEDNQPISRNIFS